MDDNDNYVKYFNGKRMWYRNGINAGVLNNSGNRDSGAKAAFKSEVLNCIKLKVAMDDDDTRSSAVVVAPRMLFLNQIYFGTERKLTESTILI